MKRAKVGALVLIGDLGGSTVVGHYLHDDPNNGPFVQFYRCPADWTTESGLQGCQALFPPVVVGIWHATRSGRWKIIGHIPPGKFICPKYLMHGIGNTWWLFDGRKERMLRAGVPEELRNLEVLQGWSAELIEDRMRTGTNPFSYEARNAWGQ